MSLYSYRIFQKVVQSGSFVRAAEDMNLTPSAVSHSIAKLEDEFGLTLFIRGKRNVELTESGRQVYQYVRDILTTEDMLDMRLEQIKGARTGPVRLGMIESAAVSWSGGVLERFRAECPDVPVEMKAAGYSTLIRDILEHSIDIAVVSHTSIASNTSRPLQFIPLYGDRLVCAAPRGSEAAKKEFISVQELSELPAILPQGGDEADVELYLGEHDVHPKIVGESASCPALLQMVRCGIGCGITPELSVRNFGYDDDIAVLPIVPFGARTLGIVTHEPKYLSPAVRKMSDCIQDYVVNSFSII